MLIAPSPLFPKLALFTASVLGFGVAYLSMPEPPPKPRLLGTYVYDPGGYPGVIVDLGEGPTNLLLREFRDGAYLVSVTDNQAVLRVDGERFVLPFEHLEGLTGP